MSATVQATAGDQLTSRGSKGPRGGRGGRGGAGGGGRGSRFGAAAAVAAAAEATAEAVSGAAPGDEDWTPADEGGAAETGRKLGRHGSHSQHSSRYFRLSPRCFCRTHVVQAIGRAPLQKMMRAHSTVRLIGVTEGSERCRGGESSSWSVAEEKLFLDGVQLYGL